MKKKVSLLQKEEINIGKAALVAGLGILIMVVSVPIAEFQIFSKLINYQSTKETAQNIAASEQLFVIGIFLHFITIICDVIVAWALFIVLKPIHKKIALLTAWFRLIFAGVYFIALLNLVKVFTLVQSENYLNTSYQNQSADLILFYIDVFGYEWAFALIIFGIYLTLLGYLVIRSTYIPKIFGWLLLIGGIGYIVTYMGKFLFPKLNTELLAITFFGEIVFMFWLLFKGRKLADKN